MLLTIITDVTILHGSYVRSQPAVCLRNDSLHLLMQLVQLHCKGREAVHLEWKKNLYIKTIQNTC